MILVDYCKGCRVCIRNADRCLEGVPGWTSTPASRMDTAFAIVQGGCTGGGRRKVPGEVLERDGENQI
jgi:hypothetical protein